jgi:hypothetical protein
MSEFTAIRAVSLTLQQLLQQHITASSEPQLRDVDIDLRSPKEMREDEDTGISLWLYQVVRNGHTLNQAPQRITPDQSLQHPLPVNLYYLVTPLTDDPRDEQALLGRILQVFNDHSILRGGDLQDSLEGEGVELRVTLEMLTLEELTRIWNSLQESYQLSVTYLVQVVDIDSAQEPVQTAPVLARESHYNQVLDSD